MKLIALPLFACVSVALASLATAQPVITPDLPVMNLDDVGVYSVGYAYRGQAEQLFPLGWSGFFDEATGVACEPFGTQKGKRTFLLHSPWRNGTGIAFQKFAFALPPEATRIVLRGFTAMRSENVANSDGVTFRLYTNGTRVFSYHRTNDIWEPFEYDLTAQRGSNVTIRFEVDPGPNNNPSFDYSFWGNRELVIEGYTPRVANRPPSPPVTLSNLWSGQSTEVAPQSGFTGSSAVSLSGDVVRFRYAGADGVLEYEWHRPLATNDGLFGTINLNAQMTGDTPVTVPLANSATIAWTQTASPTASGWTQASMGYTLWRTFNVGSTSVVVRITGQMMDKTLALSVTCDQPNVAALDIGVWGPVLRRRQVALPYYTGSTLYLPQEGLFVGSMLDWTASAASSHAGSKANYTPLTSGLRVPLRERALFTAAWHLAEVLPNPPNPPSPWRDFLGNKIVLDIWGGSFASISGNLTKLSNYGITNCVALIHDWQRSGYDNALPMHYPANASYGGDSGMSNLVATGTLLGIRTALHENYVDYYPNYDFYNTNEIALDSAGNLQKAWYNPGTMVQSFAVKPNAILPLAAAQSPQIHRRYRTMVNYLDVHSAVPPWFHVDQRAGETGAGQFSRVWDIHRQLFNLERSTHVGPVFGEGNNHWYWSGCLDGVEAQFGSGWPGNGGFTVPLAVDFDLLKIHPLQVNHGMGYYSRWWPTEMYQTNWAGPVPMIVLDRYRMQEVAYGHAGFLDGSVYANVPLAWLEHHLLSPVMTRYASSRPTEIVYEANGAWVDATAAAKLDDPGVFNCVRVRYENGLMLTANNRSNTLAGGGWLLPDLGWMAEGAGVTAGTTLRDGVVTDFADTGDSLFLNARAAVDWNLSSYRRVQPSIATNAQTGTRAFRVTYHWNVQDRLAKDYRCFVHFSTNGVIRAQQDHAISPPPSQWQPGQVIVDGPWTVTLSAALPDGNYDWLIGLFDATGDSSRVPLQGVDGGTSSIRLGTLRLANAGTTVTFIAETNAPPPDPTLWYEQHLNNSNQLVDFGDARTDGSIWLRREGSAWLLKTWPRERNFTLEFNQNRFGHPAKVLCTEGAAAEVIPVQTVTHWRLPLNGATEYRWTNPPPRLSVVRTNAAVVVSWPASANGFTLETASDAASGIDWTSVNAPAVTTNGLTSVTLPTAEPRQFHRLRL
jgi:hypothetical protein